MVTFLWLHVVDDVRTAIQCHQDYISMPQFANIAIAH